MKIFSGTANKPLAEKIAKALDVPVSPLEIHVFPDGEKRMRILDRVVDKHTVIVQPTSPPVDQNYMELFFIVDALKRNGAKSVTAVVPYLGYQRQNHLFRTGEAVSLQVIIETLEAVGVNRVVTFDLHSIKVPELFSIPVFHLSALPLFAEKIKEIIHLGGVHPFGFAQGESATPEVVLRLRHTSGVNPNFVLISPDMGGVRRVKILSEMLNGLPWASIEKERDLATGSIQSRKINFPREVKSLKGKRALIVDDMISGGGTVVKAVELLKSAEVSQIFVFATHPIFSQNAAALLQEAEIERVYVTDTILVPKDKRFPKLEILSVANIIAKELK